MDETQKKENTDGVAEKGNMQETAGQVQPEDVREKEAPLMDTTDVLSEAPVDEDSAFLHNDLSENEGYTAQFSELTEQMEDASTLQTTAKATKKRLLMPCVIVSVIIFVLAVIAGAAYILFFANSPVGVWAQDGQTTASYYIFDNEGNVQLVNGTVSYKGTYSFKEATQDTSSKITLYIPVGYTAISGDFDYSITGNLITGKSFVISSDNGAQLNLHSTSLPENTLKPAADRKTDEKIIGTWSTLDGAYDMVYCFHADGTMYMESQNMRIDAVYTLEDGQIVTTYMLSDQEGTMEEAYYFDGDTLVISGIGYQKE